MMHQYAASALGVILAVIVLVVMCISKRVKWSCETTNKILPLVWIAGSAMKLFRNFGLGLHEFLSRLRPEFEPVREELLSRHLCHSLETMPKLRSEETSSVRKCERGSANFGSGDHTGRRGRGAIVTNLAMMRTTPRSNTKEDPLLRILDWCLLLSKRSYLVLSPYYLST